jgi:hypothetical protein
MGMPLGIGIPPGAGMPPGIGIPPGAGMPPGIGIPPGAGMPPGIGIGMFGAILSIGIPILSIGMSQHMPLGLGAPGGLGASGACCCEAFAGPGVNAPEELVQVPAKKLATATTVTAKTAATVRLRRNPIVESSRSERRVASLSDDYAYASSVRLCLLLMYIDSRPAG